jgi:hypothetical protein
VAHVPAVEAWKVAGEELLWRPGGSLLWQWGRSTIELLLQKLPWMELWVIAPILLLLWPMQLSPRWGIHHVALGRSTARTTTASRFWYHLLPLLLINLSNCLHHSLLINACTHQLIVQQAGKLYQAFLQVDGKLDTVQVGQFLIHVDVV